MHARRNRLLEEFALTVPLAQGPMGGVSGPSLVAAVAEAGGLAMLPIWTETPAQAAAAIDRTRSMTARAFAVNLRADLRQHEHVALALERGIRWLHLFWGDPAPSLGGLPAGVKILATVWDDASTKAALDAGACALIAQGVEAGGHVLGTCALAELVPRVVMLAGDVPVIAAGGLTSASDVTRVMGQGAAGGLFGTRFAATRESNAHDDYKRALVAAGPGSTVRTECFDGAWPAAPHRVLRNSTYRAWTQAGCPAAPERPGEGDVVLTTPAGQPIPRYHVQPPAAGMTGEIEAAAMYAGTGVARVTSIPTVSDLVDEVRRDLERAG